MLDKVRDSFQNYFACPGVNFANPLEKSANALGAESLSQSVSPTKLHPTLPVHTPRNYLSTIHSVPTIILVQAIIGTPNDLTSATTIGPPKSTAATTTSSSTTTTAPTCTTTEDENCIEVEAIKDYYCTTDRCKNFYTLGCYGLVNLKAPSCESVKKCSEDKVQHYKEHVDNFHNKNSSPQFHQSYLHLVLPLIIATALNNLF